MLSSLVQFKYYFAKPGNLSSLTYCLEGLKKEKYNRLQRKSKSPCKIFSVTVLLHFKFPGVRLHLFFHSCISLVFFLFFYSMQITGEGKNVCVYLDISSHKNKPPVCKISAFGKNFPLTDCFISTALPFTTILAVIFMISSDLKLMRGIIGNDIDFSIAFVCVGVHLGFVIFLP